MSEMRIHKGIAYEGVGKVIRSHIVNYADTDITQATVTAITYLVDQYDSEREAEGDSGATSIQVEVTAGSVASLVFNTLQAWDVDDDGYNFQLTLPAASFPTGNKWNRVEVWIDPTSGEDFCGGIWIFEVKATGKD
jgi:hypothetical protein